MDKIKFNSLNNLIGISGKAGSGKDTVGLMILALTTRGKISNPKEIHGDIGYDMLNDDTILKSVVSGNYSYGINTYEIKKFSDKLKDIVCLLINCTREELEDRSFKETELGDEWVVWKIRHTNEITFGETNLIDGGLFLSEEDANKFIKENSITNSIGVHKITLTPRLLLQLIGTECGREIIHPNIWVNSLFSDYVPDSYEIAETKYESSKWLITDVRFNNEVDMVTKMGGIKIRVNRSKRTSEEWQKLYPGLIVKDPDGWDRLNYEYSWYDELITYEEYNRRLLMSSVVGDFTSLDNNNAHKSEIELDNYDDWDYVIENDGSLKDLMLKVYEVLKSINEKNNTNIDK